MGEGWGGRRDLGLGFRLGLDGFGVVGQVHQDIPSHFFIVLNGAKQMTIDGVSNNGQATGLGSVVRTTWLRRHRVVEATPLGSMRIGRLAPTTHVIVRDFDLERVG